MVLWTNDTIVELIQHYKEAESIWNPKHPEHKNKNTTYKAWAKIADALGGDVLELKKKMKNLVGQFYRECKKLHKCPERGSKWFAYNYLLFLQHKKKSKRNTDGHEDSSDSSWTENDDSRDYGIAEELDIPNFEIIDVKNEIIPQEPVEQIIEKESSAEPPTSSTSYQVIPMPSHLQTLRERRNNTLFLHPKVTKIIRRKRVVEQKSKGSSIKEAFNKEKTRNECEVFGELVACKLKSLRTDFARNTVEHIISNLLWEASLGKFDHPPNFSSLASPSSGSSTSYINDPLETLGYSIFGRHDNNKSDP